MPNARAAAFQVAAREDVGALSLYLYRQALSALWNSADMRSAAISKLSDAQRKLSPHVQLSVCAESMMSAAVWLATKEDRDASAEPKAEGKGGRW